MTRLDGGRPARRAIARWSLRLLRREWRQQALVGHLDDPGHVLPVPIVPLLVLVVGTPLLAASVSWLVNGGAPASLSRAAIE